jgi:hypothetical protein
MGAYSAAEGFAFGGITACCLFTAFTADNMPKEWAAAVMPLLPVKYTFIAHKKRMELCKIFCL